MDRQEAAERPTRARGSRSPFANRTTRYGVGAGQGEGWGGPARGCGRSPVLIPGQPAAKRARSAVKAQRREELIAELEDMLFDLAMNAERAETRIAAAVRLHAIYMGPPVARVVTVRADELSHMTDQELRGELERLSRDDGRQP